MMGDDDLRHLCKLSTIAVSMIRDPEMKETLRDGLGDDVDAHTYLNCLRILADAFVELQARQGMKPHFGRVRCEAERALDEAVDRDPAFPLTAGLV